MRGARHLSRSLTARLSARIAGLALLLMAGMAAPQHGAFAQATGLTLDLTSKGMGLRSNRYSMLVRDGKVVTLNVEAPGKFEVSDADTLLAQAKAA